MTYADKLKDPRWQKKRLEVLEDRSGVCEVCYEDRALHVHHDKYTGEPWEAPTHDLVLLCSDCHHLIHKAGIKAYELLYARNINEYPFYEEALINTLRREGLSIFDDDYPKFVRMLVTLINEVDNLSIKDFFETEGKRGLD